MYAVMLKHSHCLDFYAIKIINLLCQSVLFVQDNT